jgi:hypothetical protein
MLNSFKSILVRTCLSPPSLVPLNFNIVLVPYHIYVTNLAKTSIFPFNYNGKQCNGCFAWGLCSKVLGNWPAAATLEPLAGYGAPCYKEWTEQFISCIYKTRALYSLHSTHSMVMKTYPHLWICSHMYCTQTHVNSHVKSS